jgi:membrane protease YdiL (CAAX protease family)
LQICAAVVVLAATLWGLQVIAQHELDAHLRDAAAHALALNASGQTPYHWQFRGSGDIVAGRVFGAAAVAFHDNELEVRSGGGTFEVGLPLSWPIDLQRFPQLHIDAAADVPTTVTIVARETLTAPEAATAALPLGNGILDLSTLAWTPARPPTAAMLRLRFAMPAEHSLRLREARLERIANAERIDLTDAPPLDRVMGPWDPRALDAVNQRLDSHTTPLLLLSQTGRVEQQLRQFKVIRAGVPAAIVIPESDVDSVFERAQQERDTPAQHDFRGTPAWLATLLFVLFLGAERTRPPRNARVRALLEIALALAIPLWLIAGAHFDGHIDHKQTLLIAATTLYTISLGWPRRWSWNGSLRAWLLAGAVIVLAAAIGLAAHRPDTPLRAITTGHFVRYLGWALLQQYLICVVCTERWRSVTGHAAVAVYLSALAFALLHTPNASLMLATFVGGLCWCALYLRERALLPLALSHAASALLLLALLPPDLLLSAEVSARFFP